ncbi:MAG TPA: MFS transporter [Ktedonobacteraceae bacterium]|jgi:predicted MFS family arabinose efflux permease
MPEPYRRPQARARSGVFCSHTDFLKLWAGQSISLVGDQVSLLAIPLTAVVFLRADAWQMGILTAAGSAPACLFALFAGVWVDRLRRRPILIATDLGRFVLLCLVPLLFVAGLLRIEFLCLLMFCYGTLSIFFNVAYPSFVPTLLEPQALIEGNSRLAVSQSLGASLGPGLAGILIQYLRAPLALLADACSFLLSALAFLWIRVSETRLEQGQTGGNLRKEVQEGLRFLSSSPILRALGGSSATFAFWNSVLEAIFLLYVSRDLGIKPATLGLIFALGGAGFVIGALLCTRFTRWIGIGRSLLLALIIVGVSDALLPVASVLSHTFAFFLVGLAQACFGLACPFWSINQLALRQRVTPEALQGRIHASISLLTYGLPTLGALAGGALGQTLGLPQTLAVAAAGEIVSCLWIFFSPVKTLRDFP